jgi:tetratricopeptide (TPR) repeat protein
MRSIRLLPSGSRRGTGIRASCACVLVIVAGQLPKAAFAQEGASADGTNGSAPLVIHPEAERLAREGLAAYEAGRYAEAVEKFHSAYALTPAPLLLYNLAQAHRLAGECSQAVTYYEQFLATNPSGDPAEYSRESLAALEPCGTGEASILLPASLPPRPAEPPAATPGRLVPEASPLRVTRQSLGHTQRDDRAPPSKPPPPKSHLPAVLTAASAVVLVSVGGYFGWRARETSGELSQRFENGGTWNEQAMTEEARGKQFEAMSIVALASGVLAGGVSVCLFVFD